jgi:hypothetical protein
LMVVPPAWSRRVIGRISAGKLSVGVVSLSSAADCSGLSVTSSALRLSDRQNRLPVGRSGHVSVLSVDGSSLIESEADYRSRAGSLACARRNLYPRLNSDLRVDVE